LTPAAIKKLNAAAATGQSKSKIVDELITVGYHNRDDDSLIRG
jgi:hypothetical protein